MRTTRTRQRSIRRLAGIGFAALILGTALPAAAPVAVPVASVSVAEAATYNVYSCRTPAGAAAPTDGWGPVEMMFTGRTNNECDHTPSAGTLGVDLTNDSGFNMRAGEQTLLRYPAAPNTSFSRVTFWRTMLLTHNAYENAGRHWAAWIGTGAPDFATTKAIEKCGWGCTRTLPADGHVNQVKDANKLVSPPLDNVAEIFVAAGCIGPNRDVICTGDGAAFDPGNGGPFGTVVGGQAELQIQAVDAELTDPTAPTATDLTGSLTATGAMTGVRDLAFNAADSGSGLYHTTVEYRPAAGGDWVQTSKELVDANGGRCAELDYRPDTDNEFGTQVPCKLSVAGETASFDTTTVPDGDYDIRVRLEDAAGNLGTVLDRRIQIDNTPPPANTAAPGITGTPKVGQTLTALNGTWTGAALQFTYAWQRCDGTGADPQCGPIPNATSATYKATEEDFGKTIRVAVTATNAEGATTATSAPTATVDYGLVNTALPTISGTAKVGETLAATDGAWTGSAGATYKRQWQRCAIAEVGLPKCSNIPSAAGSTYKVTADDVGKVLRVVVTAALPDGTATATSKDTEAVKPGTTQTAPTEPPGGGGGGGDKTPGCNTCDPAPAPNAPKGADPTAANGVGGTPATGRFTSESRQTIRLRYGAKRTLTGRLVDNSGTPITNAVVEVLVGSKVVGRVTTDSQGRYTWKLPKGVSRKITFAYRATLGDSTYRDTAVVNVKVLAVLRVKANRTTLARNAELRLAGALLGAGRGAQVQVQARDGRAWRTIDVIRTGKGGRLVYAYKFKRVTDATFMFRLKMIGQPSVGLGGTTSKPIRVRVR